MDPEYYLNMPPSSSGRTPGFHSGNGSPILPGGIVLRQSYGLRVKNEFSFYLFSSSVAVGKGGFSPAVPKLIHLRDREIIIACLTGSQIISGTLWQRESALSYDRAARPGYSTGQDKEIN